MTYLPRMPAATIAPWAELAAELDRWAALGRTAQFWWRDDDAVAPTRALERLLNLAGGAPIAIAVIPALTGPALADAVAGREGIAVLQHGWLHRDRARTGKKTEYPEELLPTVAAAEIDAGRARLKALFGARALPVFVPPWNRIADSLLATVAACGVAALSAMASDPELPPLPVGFAALPVHLDLVAWRKDRRFIGEETALCSLVRHLRARRDHAPPTAPIGLLTHHLVMADATVAFLERLLAVTGSHPAARWARVSELI